jgi:hypothetical protein
MNGHEPSFRPVQHWRRRARAEPHLCQNPQIRCPIPGRSCEQHQEWGQPKNRPCRKYCTSDTHTSPAGATGFEPAISGLTGRHVHHYTTPPILAKLYHTWHSSSNPRPTSDAICYQDNAYALPIRRAAWSFQSQRLSLRLCHPADVQLVQLGWAGHAHDRIPTYHLIVHWQSRLQSHRIDWCTGGSARAVSAGWLGQVLSHCLPGGRLRVLRVTSGIAATNLTTVNLTAVRRTLRPPRRGSGLSREPPGSVL